MANPTLEQSGIQRILRYIRSNKWTFAKSMPQIPHWYLVRDETDSIEDFRFFTNFIRVYGYQQTFYKRTFTYFNMNGFKYWTMGAPVEETTILNRARVDYPSPYDSLAEHYDDNYDKPEYRQEDQEIIDIIGKCESLVDIGCGTGMILDYLSPRSYIGLDPSKGMIAQARQKHPDRLFINSTLNDFYNSYEYEKVISLFGTPTYFKCDYRERIDRMLKPSGEAYLMHYHEDYKPVIFDKFQVDPLKRCSKPVGDPIMDNKYRLEVIRK
jgi:SAM-dependent methyltransferase